MKWPPFAWVRGQPHLIVNFDLEPGDLPPLPNLLEELLRHHPAADILVLRPLTRGESRLFQMTAEGAEREAWAQIVVRESDRYRRSDQ